MSKDTSTAEKNSTLPQQQQHTQQQQFQQQQTQQQQSQQQQTQQQQLQQQRTQNHPISRNKNLREGNIQNPFTHENFYDHLQEDENPSDNDSVSRTDNDLSSTKDHGSGNQFSEKDFPTLKSFTDLQVVKGTDCSKSLPPTVPEARDERQDFLEKCSVQYTSLGSGIRWYEPNAKLQSVRTNESFENFEDIRIRQFNVNVIVNFACIIDREDSIIILDAKHVECIVKIPKRVMIEISKHIYAHMHARIPAKFRSLYQTCDRSDGIALVHNIRTSNLTSVHTDVIDELRERKDSLQLRSVGDWDRFRGDLLVLCRDWISAKDEGLIESDDVLSVRQSKELVCDRCEHVLPGITQWCCDPDHKHRSFADLLDKADSLVRVQSYTLRAAKRRGEAPVAMLSHKSARYSYSHSPSRSKGKGKGKSRYKGKGVGKGYGKSRSSYSRGKGTSKGKGKRNKYSSKGYSSRSSKGKGKGKGSSYTGKGGRWKWESDWYDDQSSWEYVNNKWYNCTTSYEPVHSSPYSHTPSMYVSVPKHHTSTPLPTPQTPAPLHSLPTTHPSSTTPSPAASPQVVKVVTRTEYAGDDDEDYDEQVDQEDDYEEDEGEYEDEEEYDEMEHEYEGEEDEWQEDERMTQESYG